jgi:hypothetical protein
MCSNLAGAQESLTEQSSNQQSAIGNQQSAREQPSSNWQLAIGSRFAILIILGEKYARERFSGTFVLVRTLRV